MADKKKGTKVLNTSENRIRRIKAEVKHCTKMMERLLQRKKDSKPGGVTEGGERHGKLQNHIAELKGKVK